MNIGSLCSLVQQSLLCIKHLRTEVLNNIFIFPVDMGSLFWDNSLVFVPCHILMYFPFLRWRGCSVPTGWNCTSAVVMSGCRPSGDFLVPSFLPPVSGPWHNGMANWSEHRPLTRWPDCEPSGCASQLPRDQMGRQTKIVTYPPPSWKCIRAAPEVQEGLIWSKSLPYSELEVEFSPWLWVPYLPCLIFPKPICMSSGWSARSKTTNW